MKKYLTQYRRVERWYSKFQKINRGKIHDKQSEYYSDDVYAFFINCYHLKDWIEQDKESNFTMKEVEDFVENTEELKICGDLCNGSKHLEISRPRIDKETKIASRHFALSLGSGSPVLVVKYDVVAKGKIYDAFALATTCIKKWKEFLKI